MPTLMTTGNSSGITGRCDAKCYNAKTQECHCCCGGSNHAKGLQQATENTAKYAKEIMELWNRDHPKDQFIIENLLF